MAKYSECHLDRVDYAKGMCLKCYGKSRMADPNYKVNKAKWAAQSYAKPAVKAKIAEYRAKYRAKTENQLKIAEQQVAYRKNPDNKVKLAEHRSRYRKKPEALAKRIIQRAFYEAREEIKIKIANQRTKYYANLKNKSRMAMQTALYRSDPKNKGTKNLRNKKRMLTDPEFKLSCLLRNRLRSALKRNAKRGSAVRDLGCSIAKLKIYLESKFQEGMNWSNWSFKGWHLDHKVPLSSFDLTDREQLLKACHFTNLQPLWAKDNLSKRDKLNWVLDPNVKKS